MEEADIKRCAECLTTFLEDNCDPEETWGEVYPDIVEARGILLKSLGNSVVVQSQYSERSEDSSRPVISVKLERYQGLDDIGEKAYQGQIVPDQMFDELLDEFEHLFTDDFVDRKQFLSALKRKCNRLVLPGKKASPCE